MSDCIKVKIDSQTYLVSWLTAVITTTIHLDDYESCCLDCAAGVSNDIGREFDQTPTKRISILCGLLVSVIERAGICFKVKF